MHALSFYFCFRAPFVVSLRFDDCPENTPFSQHHQQDEYANLESAWVHNGSEKLEVSLQNRPAYNPPQRNEVPAPGLTQHEPLL